MQIDDFKSTISTFTDPGTELLFEGSKILFALNGDLIEAEITTKLGDVYVHENDVTQTAATWILKRLARLPLLATRLLESVPINKHFVSPEASVLSSLQVRPDDEIVLTSDALKATLETLEGRSSLETSVLYLTSDAGEGKTSLINQLARQQASRFTSGQSDWLLVPIPLGGRHFLRFDDITVGALQNRYRFPFLYYNSFLALVRMGVLVPAFDGFEEMFVETSSGEALSAMGSLVGALGSKGAIVVAARKAYFEFENLRTQERLYDSISTFDVGFGKIEIHRWGNRQFIDYASKRGIPSPELIYNRVSERLTPSHPLLTRPVLVRRLLDIADESASIEKLLSRLNISGADFFSVFVRGIIEREANEKWIDRSGEVGAPLLTVDEHCELLSQMALAMWESRVDYLKKDSLEFVTDYFCETKRRTASQTQQIKERISGHALLVLSGNASRAVEFDHEEFRLFFLGEGLADQIRPLTDRAKGEVLSALRKGVLPVHARDALTRAIERDQQLERLQAARFILSIASVDGQASYAQENASGMVLSLLRGVDAKSIIISGLAFGIEALRDRRLSSVQFRDCYFAPSSLENSELKNCYFQRCTFSQLSLYDSTKFEEVVMDDCSVDALRVILRDLEIWEPSEIRTQLLQAGVRFGQDPVDEPEMGPEVKLDAELDLVSRLVRHFMQSTHLSENMILRKLGTRGPAFVSQCLPALLTAGVLIEVENWGGGNKRHFKLGRSLARINQSIVAAEGSYDKFLALCE